IDQRTGTAWRNVHLNNIWSPRPMSLAIVEIVEKKGPLTDIDLHKELKASFGEVSFRELNRNLINLEIGGVLRVTRLMRGKRQVELAGKFELEVYIPPECVRYL